MKKEEREHLNSVAELCCIVCRNLGYEDSPAEIHHINAGGMGMRSSNFEVLPLCHVHHRTGGYGVAVHAGKAEFEKRYGSERELLEQVNISVGL
jgi:hypothetical protein